MTRTTGDGVDHGSAPATDPGMPLLQSGQERERLEDIFRQAPAFMCVLRGPDHVCEMANEQYFRLVGQRDILGKPVREALPEVEGQDYLELLDQVYRTGESVSGTGVRVLLARLPGQPPEERHVDFVYQALRDANRIVTGIVMVGVDVTDRQKAELQLRMSEQFNRSLMDGTADCVKVLDLNGRLLHMNSPGMCAMEIDDFGPLCGLAWEAVWPAGARGDIERSVARAVSGEVSSFKAYCPTAKGTPKWWEVTVSPVRDAEGGRIVRLLSVSRDITERKQTEDSLRTSEKRFRSLVTATTQIVWSSNPEGEVVEDCPPWRAFTGQTVEQWLGWGWANAIHPDDKQATVASWQRALAMTAPVTAEYRLRRHDGEYHWMLVNVVPVVDAAGVLREWVGTNTDIDDQKRVEQALRESEERYRTATSAVSDLVWTNDVDGLMKGEQRGWADFTGQSREQYQGYGWSNAVHPEDAAPTMEAWSRAVAEKRTFVFEHRVRRRDGEWRLCAVRAVPILNADNTIREWVGVHADITERRRDEEKLRQLAAELSESSQRKDEFLATLAHELRNPLAPIRTGLQLMKLASGQEATIEKARSMVERQVTQMVRLVDDLMDVSRISRGTLELRKERVALAAVLNSAVETSLPLIEQMSHELTVMLPTKPLFVDADMTRLAQVFLNLLNNAAKYSDRGGQIQLSVELQNGDAVVMVKDSGIGIAADQTPRIFEMFTQIDGSLEKSQGGLGIGLTLVKQLVAMHGGSVEVSSEGLGKGSEFVVRLPVATEVSKSEESGNAAERLVRSPQRILVVDDNADGANSLSQMLKIMGNDTRTAYDGQAGVDMAGEFRPDVVLLDIGLPNLNGYQACRRIREQSWGKGIVLIAVTGWGQDEDRRRSQEAGFDLHLVKPVEPQVLMTLLAELQVAKQYRQHG